MTRLLIYKLSDKYYIGTPEEYEKQMVNQANENLELVKEISFKRPESLLASKLISSRSNLVALDMLWTNPENTHSLARVVDKLLDYVPLDALVVMFAIPLDALSQMQLTLSRENKEWLVNQMFDDCQPARIDDYVNVYQKLIDKAYLKQHRFPFWDHVKRTVYTQTDKAIVAKMLDRIERAIYGGNAEAILAGYSEDFLTSQLHQTMADCYPERMNVLKSYLGDANKQQAAKNLTVSQFTMFRCNAGSHVKRVVPESKLNYVFA